MIENQASAPPMRIVGRWRVSTYSIVGRYYEITDFGDDASLFHAGRSLADIAARAREIRDRIDINMQYVPETGT